VFSKKGPHPYLLPLPPVRLTDSQVSTGERERESAQRPDRKGLGSTGAAGCRPRATQLRRCGHRVPLSQGLPCCAPPPSKPTSAARRHRPKLERPPPATSFCSAALRLPPALQPPSEPPPSERVRERGEEGKNKRSCGQRSSPVGHAPTPPDAVLPHRGVGGQENAPIAGIADPPGTRVGEEGVVRLTSCVRARPADADRCGGSVWWSKRGWWRAEERASDGRKPTTGRR
jgi:hypothetical protein